MRPEILRVGGSQPSYFRTERFSEWLLALKAKFLRVLGVGQDHELIFLTGSGTAGMEAVAVNFAPDPDLLLISSGPFGDRMAEMLNRRRARFDLARLDPTQSPEVNLAKIALTRRTACFATICETSNGYFLDPSALRAAGLPEAALLLCDGISAAFSDKFDVSALDVLIIGSQKGLGLLPGMSFVLLSPKAVDVLQRRECDSLYYDFNLYIKNLKKRANAIYAGFDDITATRPHAGPYHAQRRTGRIDGVPAVACRALPIPHSPSRHSLYRSACVQQRHGGRYKRGGCRENRKNTL